MRRVGLLLPVLLLALVLGACGGGTGGDVGTAVDKNVADSYVGVWESANMRFTINKGGVGRYEQPHSDMGFFDFTYEIEDGVLTMYFTGAVTDYMASFELNDDGTVLTILHNGLPGYYEGESEFIKTSQE